MNGRSKKLKSNRASPIWLGGVVLGQKNTRGNQRCLLDWEDQLKLKNSAEQRPSSLLAIIYIVHSCTNSNVHTFL